MKLLGSGIIFLLTFSYLQSTQCWENWYAVNIFVLVKVLFIAAETRVDILFLCATDYFYWESHYCMKLFTCNEVVFVVNSQCTYLIAMEYIHVPFLLFLCTISHFYYYFDHTSDIWKKNCLMDKLIRNYWWNIIFQLHLSWIDNHTLVQRLFSNCFSNHCEFLMYHILFEFNNFTEFHF